MMNAQDIEIAGDFGSFVVGVEESDDTLDFRTHLGVTAIDSRVTINEARALVAALNLGIAVAEANRSES